MQQQFPRHALFAKSLLLVAYSVLTANAADTSGQSTIRAVSVSDTVNSTNARPTSLPLRMASGLPARATSASDGDAGQSTVSFAAQNANARATERPLVQHVQYVSEPPFTVDRVPLAATNNTESALLIVSESDDRAWPAAQSNAAATPAPSSANLEMTGRSPTTSQRPAVAGHNVAAVSGLDRAQQTQRMVNNLGGHTSPSTLSQMPRRTPIRPGASSPLRTRAKPFQAIEHEPTVSPYLNLHRNESDEEGAPNYYAFVRPQLEQLEVARRQQMEILRLQGRMLSKSPKMAAPQHRVSAMPNTGTPARYMDTAQFYGAWQQ